MKNKVIDFITVIFILFFSQNITNASFNSWWKNKNVYQKFFFLQIPLYTATTVYGVVHWEYGFSNGFGFNKKSKLFAEYNQGMDKFGHAWCGYTYASYMADYLGKRGVSKSKATRLGFYSSAAFMTFIEIMDGFSAQQRFEHVDEIANLTGAAFASLRYYYPKLGEKIDYRMEYAPTWTRSFATDYNGQKYFLALKPSGFNGIKNTALQYTDLIFGYYGRRDPEPQKATLFAGVSYNAAALVSNKYRPSNVFNYYQLPYTSLIKEFYTKKTYDTLSDMK